MIVLVCNGLESQGSNIKERRKERVYGSYHMVVLSHYKDIITKSIRYGGFFGICLIFGITL